MSVTNEPASQPYTENFNDVFNEELKRMGKKKGDRLSGLGISGGGIRSASFGLGVLQALYRARKIDDLDYLSSVSGGGYIASSFTWFRQLNKGGFPFGKAGSGGRMLLEGKGVTTHGQATAGEDSQVEPPNAVLDYIRQHGDYLTPSPGMNAMSLFGVVMRGVIVSLFVFVGLLIVGFTLLIANDVFEPRSISSFLPISGTSLELNAVLWLAVLGLGGIGVWALLFSLRTWFQRLHLYKWVRTEQTLSGKAWSLIALLVVVGLIPIAVTELEGYFNEWSAGGAGIVGVIMGFLEFRAQHAGKSSSHLASAARVTLGALAMVYGVLMGAYLAADALVKSGGWFLSTPMIAAAALLGAVLIFGILVDTNQSGLHRMYRDRPMICFGEQGS